MRKLLAPHVRAIGRPAGPAQDDAVDPVRVEGTPAALKDDLIQLIGREQVRYRISDLIRYASDASPYRCTDRPDRDRPAGCERGPRPVGARPDAARPAAQELTR
jgi:hypothetical protein